jgi:hypothetical protein
VFRANDVGGELESVTVIDIDYQTAANDAMTLCVGTPRALSFESDVQDLISLECAPGAGQVVSDLTG